MDMAHLPSKFLSALDPFSQQQTLFLPAPGNEGVLLTKKGKTFKSHRKKFTDSQAALAWCEKTRTGLVFFPPNTITHN
ncbi:MAG: hypothetical protein JWQ71_1740 [Pedosphaera sp.]|nr:hypothetical protein [Pedosphaera sp.]